MQLRQGHTALSFLLLPIQAGSLRCHRLIHGFMHKMSKMCMSLTLHPVLLTCKAPRKDPLLPTHHLSPHQIRCRTQTLGSALISMADLPSQLIPTSLAA